MADSPSLHDVAAVVCNQESLELRGQAGAGAFKETFRASDQSGRDVALKVFRPGTSAERTERELLAMQACDHANVGRLHSVGEVELDGETFTYLLEEFLGGGTLTKRLEENGTLSRLEAIALGRGLSGALAHIAERNLVHRDIKPDNVLFRRDGETPVLVDFGIVRDLARSALTRTWLLHGPGTPYYAAPEQLNNDRELIDWRTDQFALGVTLFIAKWGKHPFASGGLSPDGVVAQVAARAYLPESSRVLIREAGLDFWGRMLCPWPVERYRTPGELMEQWDRLEEGD